MVLFNNKLLILLYILFKNMYNLLLKKKELLLEFSDVLEGL